VFRHEDVEDRRRRRSSPLTIASQSFREPGVRPERERPFLARRVLDSRPNPSTRPGIALLVVKGHGFWRPRTRRPRRCPVGPRYPDAPPVDEKPDLPGKFHRNPISLSSPGSGPVRPRTPNNQWVVPCRRPDPRRRLSALARSVTPKHRGQCGFKKPIRPYEMGYRDRRPEF